MARYKAGKHQGTVHLDGVEIDDVLECDDKLGFAVVWERDDQGRVIFDGDAPKQKLLTGDVTFTMKPRD